MIISFKGFTPQIHGDVYLSKSAKIIGNVEIYGEAFIGPNVSIRGDLGKIVINKNTVIEENSIIIPGEGFLDGKIKYDDVILGEYVFIGQNSVIKASYIGDHCYIGCNCVLEKHVKLNLRDVVLSGSVIPANMSVGPQLVMLGNPARTLRSLTYGEVEKHEAFIDAYLEYVKANSEILDF